MNEGEHGGLVYRVAGVQMDIRLGETESNLCAMQDHLRSTAAEGAHLTVFPECALTGYCFEQDSEARSVAESIPGPATEAIAEACRALGAYAVFGMIELDREKLYNACVLVGPAGLVGSYRKVHLPSLGLDKLVEPGDRPFSVHDAGGLKIGMHICYDGSFPEAPRILSLLGADMLVLPTNWPPGAECASECLVAARALENHIYSMAINRVGEERGFHFIGRSRICDPTGATLSAAPHEKPALLWADVDTSIARNKHLVRVPGKHEIDRFRDRRPDMYGPIIDPSIE